MIVAIHQPNFFPWLGFFDKIFSSDRFILLDNVQFSKKGGTWTNRVKIAIHGRAEWITVPIVRNYHGYRLIKNMEIKEILPWRARLIKTFELNYRRSPFFEQEWDLIRNLVRYEESNLCSFNIHGITSLTEYLGLNPQKLVLGSSLNTSGRATELLIEMTKAAEGTIYLCGGGAEGYQENEKFESAGIRLMYQHFQHPQYPQLSQEFIPGLSIIDALFNMGREKCSAVLKSRGGGGQKILRATIPMLDSESSKNFDITFFSVFKYFLLGSLREVLKNLLGFRNGCPKVKALEDITFQVPPGELLGVLGRNGAGKSTLLRVAGGIYNPDNGRIYLRKNPTAIFEMGLFGNQQLTGRKFSDIYFSFRNIPRVKRATLIEDVKEFSELKEYFDEPMRSYSSGMIARLLFGVITAVPAEIVLLDEILSVGDQHFQGKSYKRLLKMISKGASGIFATHDWFSAVRLCTRIIVLDKGRVEFEGTSPQAIKKYLNTGSTITKRVYFKDKEELQKRTVFFRNDESFSFDFEVESTIGEPFAVGLAIELPKLAVVLILDNKFVVPGKPGSYQIHINIPVFPVSSNDCYLSLFLSKPLTSGQTSSEEIFDQISWTSGESIRLINSNSCEFCGGMISRRLKWKKIE